MDTTAEKIIYHLVQGNCTTGGTGLPASMVPSSGRQHNAALKMKSKGLVAFLKSPNQNGKMTHFYAVLPRDVQGFLMHGWTKFNPSDKE